MIQVVSLSEVNQHLKIQFSIKPSGGYQILFQIHRMLNYNVPILDLKPNQHLLKVLIDIHA